MSRFFFALSPDKSTRKKILDYRNELDLPGKLIPPANLHLTLLFMGKLSVNQQQYVISEASKIRIDPFVLKLDSIGQFKQTILWAGMHAIPEPLLFLHKQLLLFAGQAGLVHESHKYQPHVTLARNIKIRPSALKRLNKPDIIWAVSQFVLYESLDTPEGVYYQPVKVFPADSA